MAGFTRFILSHKLMIAIFWLVVTAGGFAFVQNATNALSQQFSLPGQKAYETNQAILQAYRNGGVEPPVVAVIKLPPGSTMASPQIRQQVSQVFARASAELPFARVVSYSSTGNHLFVSRDGTTTYGLIYLPAAAGFGPSPGFAQAEKILERPPWPGSDSTSQVSYPYNPVLVAAVAPACCWRL